MEEDSNTLLFGCFALLALGKRQWILQGLSQGGAWDESPAGTTNLCSISPSKIELHFLSVSASCLIYVCI